MKAFSKKASKKPVWLTDPKNYTGLTLYRIFSICTLRTYITSRMCFLQLTGDYCKVHKSVFRNINRRSVTYATCRQITATKSFTFDELVSLSAYHLHKLPTSPYPGIPSVRHIRQGKTYWSIRGIIQQLEGHHPIF